MNKYITYEESTGKKHKIKLFKTKLSFPCPTKEEYEALKKEMKKMEDDELTRTQIFWLIVKASFVLLISLPILFFRFLRFVCSKRMRRLEG